MLFLMLGHRFLEPAYYKCPIEDSGVIVIPERLRKRAKLKQHVVLIGVRDSFKLWNDEIWDNKPGSKIKGYIRSEYGKTIK